MKKSWHFYKTLFINRAIIIFLLISYILYLNYINILIKNKYSRRKTKGDGDIDDDNKIIMMKNMKLIETTYICTCFKCLIPIKNQNA